MPFQEIPQTIFSPQATHVERNFSFSFFVREFEIKIFDKKFFMALTEKKLWLKKKTPREFLFLAFAFPAISFVFKNF